MELRFDPTGKPETLIALTKELSALPNIKGLMILAGDENGWTPATLDPILATLPLPVFGGIFPQIVANTRNHSQGTLVIGLPVTPTVACIPGLSDPSADFYKLLEPHAEAWMEPRPLASDTLLVLVDGLSKRIASLVEALFQCFGLETNFIGGGAGSLSFQQKPCLITNQGLIMDAALVVHLPVRSGIGVAHGWQPVSDSIKVTQADRNTIISLDWRPAFEVYREHVEAHSGRAFDDQNFFDIAKGYPFGINKLNSEVVVRDPLMTDGQNGLVCVGEVPTGCFVRILSGTPASLIDAAREARRRAEHSLPATGTPIQALFIDCISRVLFLGDDITRELEAAAAGEPLCGALTLGEIANNGRDYLEFYNKTAVMGLLAL